MKVALILYFGMKVVSPTESV